MEAEFGAPVIKRQPLLDKVDCGKAEIRRQLNLVGLFAGII